LRVLFSAEGCVAGGEVLVAHETTRSFKPREIDDAPEEEARDESRRDVLEYSTQERPRRRTKEVGLRTIPAVPLNAHAA
jgi:hypothetical protein